MKTLFILLITSFILAIIALGSGAYNIAATDKHWAVTEKIIEWARISSIEARAKALTVPSLDDAEMLSKGAEHYQSMCTICHLAPGRKPTELSVGLYPSAPVFHEREPISDPTEKLAQARAYFWVIKNGLKMTGMPAWGMSHDDDAIWGMTAFILKAAGMTPERYQELIQSAEEHGHAHDHEHGSSH